MSSAVSSLGTRGKRGRERGHLLGCARSDDRVLCRVRSPSFRFMDDLQFFRGWPLPAFWELKRGLHGVHFGREDSKDL